MFGGQRQVVEGLVLHAGLAVVIGQRSQVGAVVRRQRFDDLRHTPVQSTAAQAAQPLDQGGGDQPVVGQGNLARQLRRIPEIRLNQIQQAGGQSPIDFLVLEHLEVRIGRQLGDLYLAPAGHVLMAKISFLWS